MKAGTALALKERSRLDEKDITFGVSREFLNVVVVWMPISSMMWAGIIYAAWRLFR